MRWPPKLVWPLVGQANSSLLPSLLSLPVQKPEDRDPAPHDMKPTRMPDMYPRGRRAVSFCSGYDARACAYVPPQN